jgi:hypothetical protein
MKKILLLLFLTLSIGIIGTLSSAHAQVYAPFVTKWGSAGTGDGQFYKPEDSLYGGYGLSVAVDSSGNVYVADSGNSRIQKFNSDGAFITKWGSFGTHDGEFTWPRGIAVDLSNNNNVYVVQEGDHPIQKFTSDGKFIATWGSPGTGDGQLYGAFGVAIDKSGNVYVSESDNHRIQKFTSDGAFITKWGSQGYDDGQFQVPRGIAVDLSDNVYVVDYWNFRIQKFSTTGKFITKWGSQGSGDGQFQETYAIAVDALGNIFVCDRGLILDNNSNMTGREHICIQKFNPTGQIINKWGSYGAADGQFRDIGGIAAIYPPNTAYVGDPVNSRIQKFDIGVPQENCGTIYILGENSSDLKKLRILRNTLLTKTAIGTYYTASYYNHSREFVNIFAHNQELKERTKGLILSIMPTIESLLSYGEATIKDETVQQSIELIDSLQVQASSALEKDLTRLKQNIRSGVILKTFGVEVQKN